MVLHFAYLLVPLFESHWEEGCDPLSSVLSRAGVGGGVDWAMASQDRSTRYGYWSLLATKLENIWR
jgi:hypothetical protein